MRKRPAQQHPIATSINRREIGAVQTSDHLIQSENRQDAKDAKKSSRNTFAQAKYFYVWAAGIMGFFPVAT